MATQTRERLNAKATYLCAAALVFLVSGRVLRVMATGPNGLAERGDWRYFAGLALALGSFSLWIPGVSAKAEAKGQSKWYGLLGLLSFIGWIVVGLLPDEWDERKRAQEPAGDYPR